mmetsp:Transcript_43156/g.105575  ORF Transcript_43156/g.105575 Transcript_43156/m.105575 type:complete len:83 (-) Transcript_43156:324-572(-)
MGDDNEYAAVPSDDPALLVKEGEDIDYNIVLYFYLAADLLCVLLFIFAKEDGWWVVPTPFLPLTFWMGWKVWKLSQAKQKKD